MIWTLNSSTADGIEGYALSSTWLQLVQNAMEIEVSGCKCLSLSVVTFPCVGIWD